MPESARVVVLTAMFFLAALVLGVVALATPSWVVQHFHGEAQFGLLRDCLTSTLDGMQHTRCGDPPAISAEWQATAAFVVIGILALCGAVVATVAAYSRSSHLTTARWLSFVAAVCFSFASLIFPVGFEGEPVGGRAFKLPEETSVGFSYIIFVVALLFIFVGQLIALKILCPLD